MNNLRLFTTNPIILLMFKNYRRLSYNFYVVKHDKGSEY